MYCLFECFYSFFVLRGKLLAWWIGLIIFQCQSVLLGIHSQGFLLILLLVTTMQWHEEIGNFNDRTKVRFPIITSQGASFLLPFYNLGILFVFILLILFVFSDAKLNPRPKNFNSCNNISIWQWNLNRVAAHNFEKVDPLEDYYRVDKVDAICLSELHLDSSLLSTC